MKKIFVLTMIIVLTMVATGCGKNSEPIVDNKELMKETINSLFSDVQKGDFDKIDQYFDNMPEKLDTFIEYLSFDEDSDNKIILKLQELIRENSSSITCDIDEETIELDEEAGTGKVSGTIKYNDFKESAINMVKQLAISGFTNLFGKGDENEELEKALQEIIDTNPPEEKEEDITFDMIKKDDVWVIKDTSSPIIDVISGNTFNSICEIIDIIKK